MKKLTKKQKIRWSILAGILALSVLIGTLVYSQKKSNVADTPKFQTVTLKKLDPLTFNGIVQATHTQDYYFDQSLGKISEINVQDGQEVAEGTALLSYTNAEYQSQADEQSTNLEKLSLAVSNAQESLADCARQAGQRAAKIDHCNSKLQQYKERQRGRCC